MFRVVSPERNNRFQPNVTVESLKSSNNKPRLQSVSQQCTVPQINILPLLLHSIVRVIRFITNMKYDFYCIYLV